MNTLLKAGRWALMLTPASPPTLIRLRDIPTKFIATTRYISGIEVAIFYSPNELLFDTKSASAILDHPDIVEYLTGTIYITNSNASGLTVSQRKIITSPKYIVNIDKYLYDNNLPLADFPLTDKTFVLLHSFLLIYAIM